MHRLPSCDRQRVLKALEHKGLNPGSVTMYTVATEGSTCHLLAPVLPYLLRDLLRAGPSVALCAHSPPSLSPPCQGLMMGGQSQRHRHSPQSKDRAEQAGSCRESHRVGAVSYRQHQRPQIQAPGWARYPIRTPPGPPSLLPPVYLNSI